MHDELTARVAREISDSVGFMSMLGEHGAQGIAAAAEQIVASLLSDGKVMVCGTGWAAATAQQCAGFLLHRYTTPRPGLAAFALGTNAAILTALAEDEDPSLIFARQIEVLGHSQDVLLVLAPADSLALSAAISAAHERDIAVIIIASTATPHIAEGLMPGDRMILVPASDAARIYPGFTLLVATLCDAVDGVLLGT